MGAEGQLESVMAYLRELKNSGDTERPNLINSTAAKEAEKVFTQLVKTVQNRISRFDPKAAYEEWFASGYPVVCAPRDGRSFSVLDSERPIFEGRILSGDQIPSEIREAARPIPRGRLYYIFYNAGYKIFLKPGDSVLTGGIFACATRDLKKALLNLLKNDREAKAQYDRFFGEEPQAELVLQDGAAGIIVRDGPFRLVRKVKAKELKEDFITLAAETFQAMFPFVSFLNTLIEKAAPRLRQERRKKMEDRLKKLFERVGRKWVGLL